MLRVFRKPDATVPIAIRPTDTLLMTMQLPPVKGFSFSNRPRQEKPLFILATGLFCVSLLTGCATVDNTFDKVKTGVSERFGGSDDAESDTLQEDVAAPAPAPVTLEPVKKPLLVDVQEKLRILGYYTGPISGKLDSRSEAAIQDFQLDNDLRIDGRASASLLREIDKALELK